MTTMQVPVIPTSPEINDPVFQGYWDKLVALGTDLVACRTQIGEVLCQAEEELNFVHFKALKDAFAMRYRVSKVDLVVWQRIFRGEISPEVANIIPSSKLAKMRTENVPDPEKKYRFYSNDAQRYVTKRIGECTSREIKDNVNEHGLGDAEEDATSKRIETAKADGYTVLQDQLVLHVPRLGKDVVVKITDELVQDLIEGLRQKREAGQKKKQT